MRLTISKDLERVMVRSTMSLTPRQLFIGLATPPWSFITAEEAVAAARDGTMPAAVEAVVATLSEADQMAARITWARMTIVERNDPLVGMLGAAKGATPDEVDAFFLAFAQV